MSASTEAVESALTVPDKAERYGWVLKDIAAGEFRQIPKFSLLFDQSYQRDLIKERVLKIQREFSWFSFGVLTVVQREDDYYYVVDGQHRLKATHDLKLIRTVPCLVFRLTSVQQEAMAFLAQWAIVHQRHRLNLRTTGDKEDEG